MAETAKNPSAQACNLNLELSSALGLWANALPRLRSELGGDAYRAWIEPLRLVALDAGAVTFAAPNAYAVSRLTTEYLHRLQARWSALDPTGRRVKLVVADLDLNHGHLDINLHQDVCETNSETHTSHQDVGGVLEPIELSAFAKTFANYEVGEANRVAVAIARGISEGPSTGDLVYFHGLHGVGKTHLLEAIVAQIREKSPKKRVLLLTAQRFLNEFQAALRERETIPFKAALRGADLLLIDDLQLICGKTATQDEFFQTLDDLISRGRTVVCSADVAIDGLQGLNARMRCVLQGGFIAKINEPDFELRRAIAKRKTSELNARRGGFDLPDEALDLIAARVTGTGRAVEGALKQVFAASALIGREASMELVVEALAGNWSPPEKSVPDETIKRRVAAFYDMTIEDLVSQRRHRAVARPRQVAMYFCKRLTRRSFPDIGQRFGGRDHTTVMHAVKRIEDLAAQDAAFAAELQEIGRKITE
ncbi:chromosomal replication initiator protein DnaA [Candidatus Phycosocius spiralis]|uniref:Chromosomal replication initiator protein DnaA n=1 Tax=Candidatus Phycosocius spiralis TaxID=2815099 RepID=A0ABQ4PTI8_9PROT|nr:chromosomal replication initiator protein DnaA [Candidatus Phycosocius spiralis]GIU66298.1 chromosomal replication initiator protein DnaA [Candidatus Phycosocius spiralis]